ncbi:MAG: class I SAM-dependent methyltransferase [Acidimicrobiales bacterium]
MMTDRSQDAPAWTDHYAQVARGWALGATLVYGPITEALLARFPGSAERRAVLDVGAGTGLASVGLTALGAFPIAVDFSPAMLSWQRTLRPPAAAADVRALPLRTDSVDDCVAAFVLNHLEDPLAGLREIVRVVRPGGCVLAAGFSNSNHSEARDAVDAVAAEFGWSPPDWYTRLRELANPLLGNAQRMRAAAETVGLARVSVDEHPLDVGVTEPEQLVDYRLGQANFQPWLDALGAETASHLRARSIAAARPVMAPYTPGVVFLSAAVPLA